MSGNTLSLFEMMQQYPTEQHAISYFERVRWGDNTHCARCGRADGITEQKKHPGRYWCGKCRKYFTAFTGTPLECSKVDTRKWLFAAYLLTTARKGISSLQLSKELDVTQKTAWYMLHRLRKAVSETGSVLGYQVEIDETFIGGKERNKHADKRLRGGRGSTGKQAVLGMRERDGHVRAMPIPDTKQETIHQRVHDHVAEGSMLYTDEHSSYNGLDAYHRESVCHSAGQYVKGMAHTNGIESVWAVLKRGFIGVYHHWSVKHMQAYVDEFAFRLNEGNVRNHTQHRLDALFRMMPGKTITYKELTA